MVFSQRKNAVNIKDWDEITELSSLPDIFRSTNQPNPFSDPSPSSPELTNVKASATAIATDFVRLETLKAAKSCSKTHDPDNLDPNLPVHDYSPDDDESGKNGKAEKADSPFETLLEEDSPYLEVSPFLPASSYSPPFLPCSFPLTLITPSQKKKEEIHVDTSQGPSRSPQL